MINNSSKASDVYRSRFSSITEWDASRSHIQETVSTLISSTAFRLEHIMC
jgi:hypothetical protein